MMTPQLYYYDMGPQVTAFSTTRHGGCSIGNYASFNINRYCGDDESHIAANRQALLQVLNVSDERLVMPHQTHETRVQPVDEVLLTMPMEERQAVLEGVDALVTDLSDVCIGVSTADCIPVLLSDDEHHAIAAVHAGWRGTVQRIVEKAVQTMVSVYGTRPEQLVAQIGPGISLDSFEVGDEVREAFRNEGFDMLAISKRYPAKWHIDLPECNRLQLMTAGVPEQNIRCADVCTYQQHNDFFSARRLGIRSGRIFTGIVRHESH